MIAETLRGKRTFKDAGGHDLYAAYRAQEPGHLEGMVLRALCAGVSTRQQKDVCPVESVDFQEQR
ncbi:MAG: hypothetical protein ACLFV4_07155 [Candidatus Hydrogenedentota bacterium]